jgi:hypothetical protein
MLVRIFKISRAKIIAVPGPLLVIRVASPDFEVMIGDESL